VHFGNYLFDVLNIKTMAAFILIHNMKSWIYSTILWITFHFVPV